MINQMSDEDLSDLLEAVNYNPETGFFVWKERPQRHFISEPVCKMWNKQRSGTEAFCTRHRGGYLAGKFNNRHYTATQIAWAIHNKEWPDHPIGHKNLVCTDNRMCNLYVVTPDLISKQMKKNKRNKSGRTGVYFNEKKQKWVAFIKGKINWNRAFNSIDEAYLSRKNKALSLGFTIIHGE